MGLMSWLFYVLTYNYDFQVYISGQKNNKKFILSMILPNINIKDPPFYANEAPPPNRRDPRWVQV